MKKIVMVILSLMLILAWTTPSWATHTVVKPFAFKMTTGSGSDRFAVSAALNPAKNK